MRGADTEQMQAMRDARTWPNAGKVLSTNMDGEFYNPPRETYTLLHEKPEHRVVMLLRLQGVGYKEISRQLGMSYQQVRNVCLQPWFQKELARRLDEAGEDIIEGTLKGEMLNCINTLVDIRDDEDAPAAARVNSAKELMERYLGKSVVRTVNYDGGKAPTAKSLEDLDAQIAAARKDVDRLLGKPTNSDGSSPLESNGN